MSMLAQMASMANSDMNSEDYLKRLYEEKRKIIESERLQKDIYKAKKLENFLLLIKRAQENPDLYLNSQKGGEFSRFWKRAEQQALLNTLNGMHPEIFNEKLLINHNKEMSNYELGNQLERGVAQVIKSFENIRLNKRTKQEYKEMKFKSGVGEQHTQIPNLIKDVEELTKQEYLKRVNYAKEKMEESGLKEKNTNNYATYVHTVQGKIDNIGLNAKLTVSSNCSKIEKDIIDCLSNATFTDKNYISKKDISFGQTNIFRIYATLGGDYNRFYRMINCFESHAKNKTHILGPQYFYKLKVIYEIAGYGMKYINQEYENIGMAKFLIWNNPTTTQAGSIRVIPTRKIIEKLVDTDEAPKDWKQAVYGPIKISQIDLSQL